MTVLDLFLTLSNGFRLIFFLIFKLDFTSGLMILPLDKRLRLGAQGRVGLTSHFISTLFF